MGYNRENFRRIRREYDDKQLKAKEAAEKRVLSLCAKIPELAQVVAALSLTGMKYLDVVKTYRGEEQQEQIALLKKENKALQEKKKAILAENGYPADYMDPQYECDLCEDTGAYKMRMCRCMKERLILAGYESSGIGHLIKTQSFDTFRTDMQKNPEICKENKMNLQICKEYCEKFNGTSARNLLMLGATGLGKTHLSTSIAKSVIDRGFDVVYDTVANILADFEQERFSRSYHTDEDQSLTEKYLTCDLLIIDDLGTEMTNQFTVSILYNLLNTRMNRGRSTIISTNLPMDEIRKRYTDRIASRLMGNFRPLLFRGEDVRQRLVLENPLV